MTCTNRETQFSLLPLVPRQENISNVNVYDCENFHESAFKIIHQWLKKKIIQTVDQDHNDPLKHFCEIIRFSFREVTITITIG